MLPEHTQVMIVGGGPCGLMLANELGRRGIQAVLVDDKPSTAFNPQANATQARTMEHYRRLGFADEIRSQGLPEDFPTDIAYFTRYATYELGRFRLPPASEARTRIHGLSGSWSAAELPHRISQKFVEQTLRRHAESLPGISVNYGWRMTDFTDDGDRVQVQVESLADGRTQTITADYLVGADGPRSKVREKIGYRYTGETGVVRDFMGGRMYAIYVRSPQFYQIVPHAPAWMNVCFNSERRAFMAAVDGKGEFAFHTQLKPHESAEDITERDALELFRMGVGAPVEAEVLSHGSWTAGHSLVAEHLRKGRVFIGGDAAHLFTPAGGLGYNTAVEDAVNLGWKLAAVLKGTASEALLDSYEAERRPLAVRNTAYAKAFADSLGLFAPTDNLEEDSATGAAARAEAGAYFEAHGRAEFNIPGVTFGGRYDGSPAIVADGTLPPPDTANEYIATACPGGRPPHMWMEDDSSLYDSFGFEWTLLCLDGDQQGAQPFAQQAHARNMDLKIIDATAAHALYQARYALIRPDQIVAWRGDSCNDASGILDTLNGRATHSAQQDHGGNATKTNQGADNA